MAHADTLSESRCRELLGSGVVGRIGLCTAEGPVIVPVNFSVVGEKVIIRTAPGTVVASEAPGRQVAVEIDHVDYETHQGWSVLATGTAEVVTDEAELARIRRTWNPQPWASGNRTLYLAIRWRQLSGRRLGSGWTHANEVPVRRRVGTD
jgi:nitroimidazol reductase NimA-like FMN-containing flavoprotein (pyridoxamine 5'-phosphate oxidase superfamily)